MPKRSLDNPLVMTVMGVLFEQPMHPYQIGIAIKERGANAGVRFNRGTLYDLVEALHRQGWLEERDSYHDGSRPQRTVYALTEQGRDAYLHRIEDEIRVPRDESPRFLTAVQHIGALGPRLAHEVLTERAGTLAARIEERRTAWREVLDSGAAPRLFVIEAEYGLALLEAELDWVRRIAAEIEDGTLRWPRVERAEDDWTWRP